MQYREATRTDAGRIAALHAESWRASYRGAASDEFLDGGVFEDRERVWDERMSSPPSNQFVVVAEESPKLAGFACAYGDKDPIRGTYLDNLHVLGEWQGTGVGRGLMARVVAWCVDRYPDSGLYLLVLEQNERARRFYERLGATDAESTTWLPPGGGIAPSRIYTWTKDEVADLASLLGTS